MKDLKTKVDFENVWMSRVAPDNPLAKARGSQRIALESKKVNWSTLEMSSVRSFMGLLS